MPVFVPLLIIVAIVVIAVLVFGCSASMIGYGLLKTTAKFGSSAPAPSPQPPQPTSSGWTIQYSKNVPTQMTQASDGTYFVDLPSQDGLHYVVEKAPPLAIGRTITMIFSLTGTGTLKCSDASDPGSPHVRLFIQRQGDTMSGAGQYQQYRYWSLPYADMVPGDYTLTASIAADQWTDVLGKPGTDYQSGFIGCISNAAVIGFTFGGSFAGHGLYVANGSMRFTLKSFTIA